MVALLCFVFAILALTFKTRSRLEAENAALRHQLIVLRRQVRNRVQLYRWFPSILKVLTIVHPETLIRWHRAAFRRKSRSLVWTRLSARSTLICGLSRATLKPQCASRQAYARYYNDIRTHWSLDKDAPVSRPVQRIATINPLALLGGLHHHYVRI
jgi:hypothetical protein